MTLVVVIDSDFGDDAIAPQLAKSLRADLAGDEVEVETCARPATRLMPLLEESRPTILIDAVLGAGNPGEVIDIDREQLLLAAKPLSPHDQGIAEVLSLASLLDRLPRRLFILGLATDPLAPLQDDQRRQAKSRLLARIRQLME